MRRRLRRTSCRRRLEPAAGRVAGPEGVVHVRQHAFPPRVQDVRDRVERPAQLQTLPPPQTSTDPRGDAALLGEPGPTLVEVSQREVAASRGSATVTLQRELPEHMRAARLFEEQWQGTGVITQQEESNGRVTCRVRG